jgi:TRAP-type mannitol/chloroaromatic compound transport system permease small subunit
MKIIKFYIRIVDRLNKLIALAVSMLIPGMMIVLIYEVVARYVFQNPTIWAYDTAIFMFGYCGLLAGAYVHKLNEHVNVDIILVRLSPRTKAILDSIVSLLFFFFIILLIIHSWETAKTSLIFNERGHSEWAPFIGHFKLMIPIGAFLLFLQGIANWIRSLYRAITDKELNI